MKKEEKHEIVLGLKEKLTAHNNFYIADTSNLTVAQVNVIRRKCFEKGITMQVAKNTLIRKAMEATGNDYSELFGILKGTSAIMFSEVGNAPAKLIKEVRKNGEKPALKAAYIDSAVFIGDNQLDVLIQLKSKEELVGDIIALLQSPAKNVISGLKSGGNKLAGILKTLEERGN
jgi:large subunit ribosomal protein L10